MEIKDAKNMADKKVLEMIWMAAEEARRNTSYYVSLMEKVNAAEEKEIVRQIYLDEVKHDKMLCDIYKKSTGKELEFNVSAPRCSPYPAKEFQKNIFAKLEQVEFYRRIYFMMLNFEIRDMLFEIITDEQNNAVKFSYLLFSSRAI